MQAEKPSAIRQAGFLLLLAVALGASLIIFNSCASERHNPVPGRLDTGSDAIGNAREAPTDVDPELWAQLTAELKLVLTREGTARRSAAAPAGPGSQVPDLSIHMEGGQDIFTWSYRQHGDYDLNGVVTVSDLTQIGVHFGKTTLDDDWQVAQLADGDGNGEVNVSDVTPIGQNFGGQIDGYELQGRIDSGSEYLLKSDLAFTAGDKLSGLYPQYSVASAPVPAGPEYRVVPYVENGGEREYGTESNIFRTLTSSVTNWHTRRGNNNRDNLAQAAGPVSPDEVWQLDLDGGVFFLEPIVDLTGTIYVGTYQDSNVEEVQGNGYVYAIDQEGSVNWRFKTSFGVTTTLAASRNGRVVVGDLSGIVYCLAPDGKQLWRQQLLGIQMFTSILVNDTGTVYCLTHFFNSGSIAGSTLYKLTSEGEIDWSKPLNNPCLSTPFFNTMNEVTVIDRAGELYSFDSDGVSTQNFMLADQPLYNGLLGYEIVFRGGLIVFTTDNGRIRLCLEDDSWTNSINLGEDGASAPTLDAAANIILGTTTTIPNPAYKLNHYTGGTENWDMPIPGDFMGGVVVDTADRMYLSTFLGDTPIPGSTGISCILPNQTIAWFYPTDGAFPFTPVIADDNLLVCALLGDIYGQGSQASIIGIRSN